MTLRRLVLLAALLSAACRSGEPRIQKIDLQDFPAPAMFRETALQQRRPFVLELPPRGVEGRFDLKMTDATMGEALEAMVKLDPSFQQSQHGEVLVFRPSGKADVDGSPFSLPVAELKAEGGAGDVLRKVFADVGIVDTTDLIFANEGVRRPVKLDLKRSTVRDAMIEIAHQAHLGFIIEPGAVSVVAVPE